MKTIYFDNAATHPLLPQVKAQIPYYLEMYGNPSSTHVMGQEAYKAIESARRSVADYLGCWPEQIIFTSGATESNNLVISAMKSLGYTSFSTVLEHPSLLCEYKLGHSVEGYALQEPIKSSFYELLPKDRLYCVSWTNNEIGVTLNIPNYSYHVHKEGNFVLVDATAAIGFEPRLENFCKRNEDEFAIPDFITFSGHKIGSLKGIGVLFCKNPLPKSLLGGHQEWNMRPGTQNVLGILSLQDALNTVRTLEKIKYCSYFYDEKKKIYVQSNYCENQVPEWLAISNYIYTFFLNETKLKCRIYSSVFHNINPVIWDGGHILNMSFKGVDSFELQQALSNCDICVSNGAACEGSYVTYSHVLEGIGYPEQGSIRISIGFNNTLEEAKVLCETLKGLVEELRGD